VDTPQESQPELHILTREEIWAAEKTLPTEIVPVPEWGGSVIVRGLTGTDRDAFEATLLKQRGRKQEANLENFRAKLIVRSVVDEKGSLLFGERDISRLGQKSALALERVYEVAQRLSKLSPEDVEELTADLGKDQSDDSGTDLQDTSESLSENFSDVLDPPSLLNG
jgi:hypothetical protein